MLDTLLSQPLLLASLTAALGLVLGLLPWLLARTAHARREAELTQQLAARGDEIVRLGEAADRQRDEQRGLQDELRKLREQLAAQSSRSQAELKAAADKLQLIESAREQMGKDFRALSSEILEEKTRRFTETNREGLKQILDPLRERIAGFEKQVADSYDRESKDRRALFEQVRTLQGLNQQVSDDARNLARALRGESKAQGNWGEMILERILEASGLTRGREYDREVSAGKLRPDAVVHLPEGRDIIIDAKVSLTAYVAATEAATEEARETALKEHVASVRRHIQGLSAKDYQHIESISSPDFILMFVPSEAAYIEAVRFDPKLQEEAIARHVGLVSPSTLLPTLRTVEYLWRVDNQNRNAQEIALQAGRLYDKFVGFEADLAKIGERLDQAQTSWDEARNKLVSGRGNLVSRTEKLRKLGARTSKQIDAQLNELAGEPADDED